MKPGENREPLCPDGTETFDIGLDDKLKPQGRGSHRHPSRRRHRAFTTVCRVDTPVEVDYYRNGGILHKVLRDLPRA